MRTTWWLLVLADAVLILGIAAWALLDLGSDPLDVLLLIGALGATTGVPIAVMGLDVFRGPIRDAEQMAAGGEPGRGVPSRVVSSSPAPPPRE